VARPPRIEVAGGIYHVVARGNERRLIYRDDNDRATFLELLALTLERHGWQLLAYCLMGNHYHLLVRTQNPDLARGMHYLNARYAQHFNRRHGRVGHLFQGRYKAILVQSDGHLLLTVRYIVRNPVRARLCETPDAWAWSSHAATAGSKPPGQVSLALVLGLFHPDRRRAHKLYRAYVHDDSTAPVDPTHPLINGDEPFIARHLALIEPSPAHPNKLLAPPRTPLTELLPRHPTTAEIAAAKAYGHTLTAIADHLGLNKSTISRRLHRPQTTP
jgi:REP element-mobilizing transposase RayT